MVAQELSNGALTTQRCECGRTARCSYEGIAVCRSCWEDLASLSAGDAMYSRPMVFVRKIAWGVLLLCASIGALAILADLLRNI